MLRIAGSKSTSPKGEVKGKRGPIQSTIEAIRKSQA
jgi:hypothetical protein